MSLPFDLNIDLGELENEPEELYELATTVNLACGGHAGDERSMRRGIELALRSGARIAAHPSYPDREHFGRMRMTMTAAALYEAVVDQCAELAELAKRAGGAVAAVKPHGALYHDARSDENVSAPLLDAVTAVFPEGVVMIGPPEGVFAAGALTRGLGYAREGFADRRYGADGQIVPRSAPLAVLDDPDACARQAIDLAASGRFDTLCVHGDNPRAVLVARKVRRALESR
jgi:UPF0271 protein